MNALYPSRANDLPEPFGVPSHSRAPGPRVLRPMHVGLHTGECEADGQTMRGAAVDLSLRLSHIATVGDVLVTGTVRDLVAGSGLLLDGRGQHRLGGDHPRWHVFAATQPAPNAVNAAR